MGVHDASFDCLLVWLIVLVKCLWLSILCDALQLATSQRPEIIPVVGNTSRHEGMYSTMVTIKLILNLACFSLFSEKVYSRN